MTASRLVRQSGFALLTKNIASQEEAQADSSGSRALSWRRYKENEGKERRTFLVSLSAWFS